MPDKTETQKLADELYSMFKGNCIAMQDIIYKVKDHPPSTIRVALRLLEADGKVLKYKIHSGFHIYCFGKKAALSSYVNYEKIEECIKKHAPSFKLIQIIRCLGSTKPSADISALYVVVIYTLMRMVAQKTIHSFTVVRSHRGTYKVIIRA